MKLNSPIIVLFIVSLSGTVFGQPASAKLEGKVVDNKSLTIAGVRIVAPGGQAAVTDSKGHFTISFPASVQPGQATRIQVIKSNWVVYHPMFGNCVTQGRERNYEPLRVVIVPKGSPLALSPKRLSQVIAQWTAERLRLRAEVRRVNRELDEYDFLRRYAEEYGFTLEQFRTAADQWAQIKESDDKEERALKEYWGKNYGRAEQLIEESIPAADEELKQAIKKRNEASLRVIRRYQLLGNSRQAQYKFREALEAYNEIEKRFNSKELLKEDFAPEWAVLKSLIGNAKVRLGERLPGADGTELLTEALDDFRTSAAFYPREQSPQSWAAVQTNLGGALFRLGERSAGVESFKYLNDSALVFGGAIEALNRATVPREWARAVTGLGTASSVLGSRERGHEGIELLSNAIVLHRLALEVFSREDSPEEWATTHDNLGNTLWSLGELVTGPRSIKFLNEAIAAYRAVLDERTRESFPQEWADTQNNLGAALTSLGRRVDRAESPPYLSEAVVRLRTALEIRTRNARPKDWAFTQNNLGVALQSLGAIVTGAEAANYLSEAVVAHRAVLEEITREDLPLNWASTQSNLGAALSLLGERVSGERSESHLNDALTAYQAALEVATLYKLADVLATIRLGMARVYFQLHNWTSATEAFTDVLRFDPNNEESHTRLSLIYLKILFKFDQAFILNQQWLVRHPEDISAQTDFAEAYFAVSRFSECAQRINALLKVAEVPVSSKTSLRAIEIASLLAENKPDQVPFKIDALVEEVTHQPAEFRVTRNFEGTKRFIDQNEKLAPYRTWLAHLFDALASKDRDTILRALQDVRSKFNKQN